MSSKLRDARENANMSLNELAEAVGTSKAYIWQLENKDAIQPRVGLAYRLSTVLGVPIEDLFEVTIAEEKND